jgi:hypothetical protein
MLFNHLVGAAEQRERELLGSSACTIATGCPTTATGGKRVLRVGRRQGLGCCAERIRLPSIESPGERSHDVDGIGKPKSLKL